MVLNIFMICYFYQIRKNGKRLMRTRYVHTRVNVYEKVKNKQKPLVLTQYFCT